MRICISFSGLSDVWLSQQFTCIYRATGRISTDENNDYLITRNIYVYDSFYKMT